MNEAEADADAAETLLEEARRVLATLVEAQTSDGASSDVTAQAAALKQLLSQVEAHLAASALATAS